MPEPDFKKAIIDAARRAQGQGGLSADFAKRVDAHWNQFTAQEIRVPANSNQSTGQ